MGCIGRAKEKTFTEIMEKERKRERERHVRVGEGLLYKHYWKSLYPVKMGSFLGRPKMQSSPGPLVSLN